MRPKEKSVAHALGGASGVAFFSLPLMNSFNKTEAAVFSCRLCFLRAFPFISLFPDFFGNVFTTLMVFFVFVNENLISMMLSMSKVILICLY